MAGVMDMPMHQHAGGAGGAGMKIMHKRIAIKRQGPGGGLQDGTGDDDDDDGTPTTGGSLSLTRGPGGGNGGASSTGLNTGGDDDDTSSSTEAPTRSRTRTTISSNSTPSDTTPTTSAPTTADTSITTVPDTTSSVPVVTTTVQTTSTSTSFSEPETTSTTLEEETTTSEEPTTTPTTSASRSLVTSFVTASGALTSLASSATNSLASSNNNNNGSSGPSAGTVVGIVAGALVGVVVLSGIVGYVFRTKCTSKNDEDDFDGENPFGHIDDHNTNAGFGSGQSRAEMRRDSQLLADDGDSIHQMSELGHGGGAYNNNNAAPIGMGMGMGMAAAGAGAGAGAYALNRGNSTNNGAPLPGLQRQDTMNPRPPTMIQRHYANQQQMQQNMPSFQPGQIVYPTGNGGQPQHMMNQSSPYPTFPHNAGGGGVPVGGVFPSSSSPPNNNDLSRNQSYRAIPEQYNNNNNGGYDYHHQQEQEQEEMPARSGTPEYANPQQYFHQATESFGSGIGPSPFGDHNASPAHGGNAYTSYDNNDSHMMNGDGGMGYGGGQTNDGGAAGTGQQGYASSTPRDNVMKGSDRAKRTLSVRNGALDDDGILRESVYGGM